MASTDPATAEDRRAAIRARLDAATPGHWYPISIEFRGQVSHSVKSSAGSVLAHTGYGPKGGSSHANAEFMVHARQDVETLLSELEAAQARADQLQKRLDAANSRYSDVVLKVSNLRYDDVDGARFTHEHADGDGPECAGCWAEAIDEALGLGEEADSDR